MNRSPLQQRRDRYEHLIIWCTPLVVCREHEQLRVPPTRSRDYRLVVCLLQICSKIKWNINWAHIFENANWDIKLKRDTLSILFRITRFFVLFIFVFIFLFFVFVILELYCDFSYDFVFKWRKKHSNRSKWVGEWMNEWVSV
jgi:hypothetical protein